MEFSFVRLGRLSLFPDTDDWAGIPILMRSVGAYKMTTVARGRCGEEGG